MSTIDSVDYRLNKFNAEETEILRDEEIEEIIKLMFIENFKPKESVIDAICDRICDMVLEDPVLELRFKKKLEKIEKARGEKREREGIEKQDGEREKRERDYNKKTWLRGDTKAISKATYIIIEILKKKGIEFIVLPVGKNDYAYYYANDSILREGADARLMGVVGEITKCYEGSRIKTRTLLQYHGKFLRWEETNPSGFIPMGNGKILDLEFLTLHDKVKGYFTVKAGTSLKESHLDTLKKYLKEYGDREEWEEGERALLLLAPNYRKVYYYLFNTPELRKQAREMLGSIFYEGVLRKAFIIVGSAGTGKSTFADAIKKTLGELASSISLTRLFGKENRLVTGELAGKYANITSESPDTLLRSVDWFKTITGDEELSGEVKYRRPFKFFNKVKLITFCNELPLFEKVDEAILDRLYIIEIDAETIPKEEQDKTLRFKIKNELPYVFLHLLWCYKELEYRGFKLLYGPDREKVQELIKERATQISDFIEMCCERGDYLEKGTKLYDAYLEWCGRHSIVRPLGRNLFYAQLTYMGYERVLKEKVTYFKGLRLIREESSYSLY